MIDKGQKKHGLFALLGVLLLAIFLANPATAKPVKWKKVKILVYTKNGVGFVHDNIENSIIAIKAMGEQYGFKVDATEDPSVFTDENLKQYDALVFSNTNNQVFDTDEQRVALMRYIQAGGGFVGIHSTSGTER
ncbi:MAG TPA: ThuA domain-containing protein, partial [Sphingobacterium sp.]|nr:ThuA domain-containing protein [Sphingobacterium sp.]